MTLQRGTTYKGPLVGKPGPVLLGLGSINPGGGFRVDGFKTYGGDCPPELMLGPGELYASLKGATKDGKMIGSVARVPPSVLSGRLTQDTVKLVLREPTEGDAEFLYWVLRTPQYRDYCAGHAMGSAVVALSRRDFLSYPVPPRTHSRDVLVTLFEAVDDKIELNRRMSETLEAIARALFKSWFVDFDPVRAKAEGRDPGLPPAVADLFPSSFEESELGPIPAGWPLVRLSEIVTATKGCGYKSEDLIESDTALVSLKSFARGGGYRPEGLKSFAGKYKPEQIVGPGEVVLACTDVTQAAEVIGRTAVVRGRGKFNTLVASLDTLILRPARSEIKRAFIYALGRTERFIDHTFSYTSGTTVLHLGKDALPTFELALPPNELIELFDRVAGKSLERIQGLEEESATLATVRDALLPKLVSGEVRVMETERVLEAAV